MPQFLLRLGSLGDLYIGEWPHALERGQRVIVRTEMGVQLAETVGPFADRISIVDAHAAATMLRATILRVTTEQDELLIRRLDRHKREAVEACRQRLIEAGSAATLLDVDQLFDGGTLVMHFLGPVDDLAQSITGQVVEQYESIVRTRHFAKLLRDGCGPSCGTQAGNGCSTQCAGCSIKCH